MRRGQIWTRGEHDAVLVVGADSIARGRPVVWGIPITAERTMANYPLRVLLSPHVSGLSIDTYVQVMRGIEPVRVADLGEQVGLVGDRAMARISSAIVQLFELHDGLNVTG